MKVTKKEISEFLGLANKNTYANKEAEKVDSTKEGSYDYHFEKGDFTYHDTYYGVRDFIGGEVVHKGGNAVWGANYFGYLLDPSIDEKEIYGFLRDALMEDCENILPVRGPKEYKNEELSYVNKVDGDIGRFIGEEEISFNKKLVYRCWYHGGWII